MISKEELISCINISSNEKLNFSSSWKIWGTDEEEIQEQKKPLENKHPGNLETKISLFFIDL